MGSDPSSTGGGRLTLPRWRMGQVLLPGQFEALQSALLCQLSARHAMAGLPSYGVAKLEFDQTLLAAGVFAVEGLRLVYPDGLLIDVPDNATMNNLNLAESGATQLELFVHVLDPEQLPSAQPPEVVNAVERVRHQVVLSTAPRLAGAAQSMKLAEVALSLAEATQPTAEQSAGQPLAAQRTTRGLAGEWTLSSFSPPLLRVTTSPFLGQLLSWLSMLLDRVDAEMDWLLLDTFLRGEQRTSVLRFKAASYQLRTVLADYTDGGLSRHAFVLFDAVRSFYVELCLVKGTSPTGAPIRYLHDDPTRCFGQLQTLIDQKSQGPTLTSPRLPFVRENDRIVARPFPAALTRSTEVYVVVQRSAERVYDLCQTKLGSPSRLFTIQSNVMTGVAVTPADPAGLRHSFGTLVDFYAVTRDREWEYALAEGAVCFYAPGFEDINAALFWSS